MLFHDGKTPIKAGINLFTVSVYSALRLKNIMELKRYNIDFKGNWINLKQSKTKKFLQIPIGGKLKRALNKIKVWPVGDNFIFCNLNSSYSVRKAASTSVARSFRRAGFKGHSFIRSDISLRATRLIEISDWKP
jgi:hypothetical protein